jgi:hypothetical protein
MQHMLHERGRDLYVNRVTPANSPNTVQAQEPIPQLTDS